MNRFDIWALVLSGIISLIPTFQVSAAGTETGDDSSDVFQPSDYEVNWMLPDGIKNGGILTLTFHEPIRLIGNPKFRFDTHFRIAEWIDCSEHDIQLIENHEYKEWILMADMSYENKPYYEDISQFTFILDANSFESITEPRKYNDEIVLWMDVSGVDDIEVTDQDEITEIFNLQGERVSDTYSHPGIYIVKEGKSYKKRIIR